MYWTLMAESNSQRLNNCRKQTQKQTQKTINTVESWKQNTIMKSNSGREHVRRMIVIFGSGWGWGCEDILMGLVIE